jgi:aryl-alcohol dehydrogenase-like predicted oxidoreductase
VEYRALGDSGLRVSEICLGTWTTFGGSLDENAAIALVDAAFENGVNFFDTANVYSEGRSEEVLGRALAGRPRDSFVVATKVYGEMPNGDRGLSREQVLKQIDDSLARLQLDHVDLYQCHSWDVDVPVEETLGALTEVVDAGKARFVGVSNWSGEEIQGAVELARERGFAKIVSSQPQYSLLHREPEQDVIPASRENGVSQIVYSPLAQGVLSGKYRPGESFAEDTRAAARGDGFMSQYLGDDVLERVQRLGPIADGLGITTAQLALAWVLHEPNVASAIVGASRLEQLRDNAAASGVALDGDTVQAIEDAISEPEADRVRAARSARRGA